MYLDDNEKKRILGATEDNQDLRPMQEALLIYPDLINANPPKEQTELSYQFLQTLDMSNKYRDDNISKS